MKGKIINSLYKFALILFAVFFIYIFALNIFHGLKEKNYVSFILFFVLITGYLFFFSKIKKIDFKYQNIIKWILLIFSFFFLIFLGYQTRVSVTGTWDFGAIMRYSYSEAHDNSIGTIYFARYPNNIPLFIFETILCRLVLFFYKGLSIGGFRTVTISINAMIIFSSMLLLNRIIKKVIGDKASILSTFVMIFFCPLYLYCTLLYTDTISMLLSLIALTFYFIYDTTLSKNKKIISLILTIIFIYIGFKFKATNIFLLIALIIEFVYENSWKEILISCLILVVVSIPINYGIDKVYRVSQIDKNTYEFPHTHWLMMTLNPKTKGGYSEEDVRYTASFIDYDSKKSANMEKIKERIENYGLKKLLYRILVVKNNYTWTDPTFTTGDYLNRKPVKNNIFTNIFSSSGKYHNLYLYYITSIYFFILFGVIISAYFNLKDKNQIVFISQLMLIGIFLFELVWECIARYVYSFLPFLIITTCYGYTKLLETFEQKRKEKNYKIQEV